MMKCSKIILLLGYLCLALCLPVSVSAQENNPHGKDFNIECEKCHNTDNWKVELNRINFDHNQTGFPLKGQHNILLCSDCHTSLQFKDVSSDCFSCHVDAHKNTLGLDCIKCHNTNSWKPVNMQQIHNQFRFPLTGVHQIEDCELCHSNSKNFIFTGTSINCIDCHRADFVKSANPPHMVMDLSKNCEECHTTQSMNWTAERFKHVQLSFAGAHVNLTCSQCHNSEHLGYTQECYGCHKSDFEKTTDPSHLSNNFPHECSVCHNTDSWAGAKINHDLTSFPLTGSHRNVECKSCHIYGYSGVSTQCFDCHGKNYNSAPQHLALNYPHNCDMCHNTSSWNQSNFNHSSTAFQLTGSHVNTDCNSCHKNGFAGTPTECFSCHESAYNQAPDHLTQGYPHTCETCHNTNVWNQVTFDHSSTGFILTGAHINTNCSDCHSSGFPGTPKQCENCHMNNYNSTTNPSHTNLNLPVNCEQCHSTNPGWTPAQFPIHANYFVFTGAHINIKDNCKACHNDNYSSTPNTCFGCHQNDYNNTTNPSHSSIGFPTSCTDCHNQNSWSPANFDHDSKYFPIYSGSHSRVWSKCSDCHTNSSNYSVFSCINCHEHNKSETDNHHNEVGGYSYNSSECYRCHPKGRSEGLSRSFQRLRLNAK